MSAAVATGTPSAANPAASTAPVTAGTHGLDAVLGDLSDVGPIDGADNGDSALDALTQGPENEPGAAADAETPEEQPEVPKAQPNLDEILFSEESLSTKEGILKAKSRIKELQRKGYEAHLATKRYNERVLKRAEKLKVSVDRFKAEKTNHDLLLGNVRSNLQGLHSGDPDTILTALGNLTGQDGLKAYELLTSRIVNRGQSKLDPQVQAVLDAQRQEIEQLKQGLTQRAEQEREQQLSHSVKSQQQQLLQLAQQAQGTPHLQRFLADDPEGTVEFMTNEIAEAHARGERLDVRSYFGNLEARLAPHFQSQAPKGEAGTSPAPKLAQAQSSPGRSVGPRTAAAAQTPRTPAEEESLRALADDPALMSLLGY